jgi:hypothetical protein
LRPPFFWRDRPISRVKSGFDPFLHSSSRSALLKPRIETTFQDRLNPYLLDRKLLALLVVRRLSARDDSTLLGLCLFDAANLLDLNFCSRNIVFAPWEVLLQALLDAASLRDASVVVLVAFGQDLVDDRLIVRELFDALLIERYRFLCH